MTLHMRLLNLSDHTVSRMRISQSGSAQSGWCCDGMAEPVSIDAVTDFQRHHVQLDHSILVSFEDHTPADVLRLIPASGIHALTECPASERDKGQLLITFVDAQDCTKASDLLRESLGLSCQPITPNKLAAQHQLSGAHDRPIFCIVLQSLQEIGRDVKKVVGRSFRYTDR